MREVIVDVVIFTNIDSALRVLLVTRGIEPTRSLATSRREPAGAPLLVSRRQILSSAHRMAPRISHVGWSNAV
jgi:hypothetical protein